MSNNNDLGVFCHPSGMFYRNVKTNQNKGFTLIELMIATSLLMIIMFTGYYAYSLYSQKWQKRVQTFWHNTEQYIHEDSLHRVISSAMPYVVKGKDNKAVIYFEEDNNKLRFISSSAIFSPGPALIQLRVEAISNSKYANLIYQEQSLEHKLVLDIEHEADWQHEVILLEKISEFTLSYYGWPTFNDALRELNVEGLEQEYTQAWYQTHKSHISRLLPEQLKISYINDKGLSDFNLALSGQSLYRLLNYVEFNQ